MPHRWCEVSPYEQLYAEVLKGMEPPSPPCNKTRECKMAGGCYYCQVIQPYEQSTDRRMDAEMRERQRTDPAFAEEQRRWVAELLSAFSAKVT